MGATNAATFTTASLQTLGVVGAAGDRVDGFGDHERTRDQRPDRCFQQLRAGLVAGIGPDQRPRPTGPELAHLLLVTRRDNDGRILVVDVVPLELPDVVPQETLASIVECQQRSST
jgi:hypothetical protein